MNTRIFYAAALLIIVATVVGGCSQLNDDLPAPAPAGATHDEGWATPVSSNFHGKVLKADDYNSTSCLNCHGRDVKGGTSGVPCSQCHAGYPHPVGWEVTTSSAFHGTALKQTNWNTKACDPCHAPTYQGGTSGKSCYTCHASYPHSSGWMTPSTGFHGLYIANASWDMRPCKSCHGSDYLGGRTGISCTTCHSKPNGPENCTTCHGGTNAAPPAAVKGDTATTVRGVGAHQIHVVGPLQYAAQVVPCADCHTVPGSVYDPATLIHQRLRRCRWRLCSHGRRARASFRCHQRARRLRGPLPAPTPIVMERGGSGRRRRKRSRSPTR